MMSARKSKIALFVSTVLFIALTNGQTIDWAKKANPAFNSINGVAFRADGQKVLSGTNCHPASIRIFDVTTGAIDWDYTVGSSYLCIMGVAFSSNSNYIAAIEEFGNIFIFDNTGVSPVIIDTINTGTSYAFSTAISPSNNKVAVGCSNGKMKIYNIPSGTLSNDIIAHSSWVTSVAYSSNGNNIVTGGSDDKVKIWSSSAALLYTCTGHTGDITNVKVTPDNNYVISSSKDNKIKIWDIATGLLVRTITGHANDVNGIDISPDGTKIVSASSDSTCKIWDFSTGNLITTFAVADSGVVNTVAWSPNGDKIVTGNAKSDIVLWSIPATLSASETILKNSFTVYPNPALDVFTIELKEDETLPVQMEITDASGRLLMRESIVSMKQPIDISVFKTGMYFMSLQSKRNKNCIKIVKQ